MALTETRSRERETLDCRGPPCALVGPARSRTTAELMRQLGGAEFALSASVARQRRVLSRAGDDHERLIVEHGTVAVAVEADWPDALRVDPLRPRPALAMRAATSAVRLSPLSDLMWRNTAVLEFVEWLRGHNAALPPRSAWDSTASILYSLFASIGSPCSPTSTARIPAAPGARAAATPASSPIARTPRPYGYATRFGMSPDCEDAVVAQLRDMLSHARAQAALEARGDAPPASMPSRTPAW
jgi:erythromycin esterase-like protein